MINKLRSMKLFTALSLVLLLVSGTRLLAATASVTHGMVVYNIKDFGATGSKADNAQSAIQKAIDTAAVKGGTVYLPPGDYTSRTIHLRSHVNIYLEAGATLYASETPTDFADQKVKSKEALLLAKSWKTFPSAAEAPSTVSRNTSGRMTRWKAPSGCTKCCRLRRAGRRSEVIPRAIPRSRTIRICSGWASATTCELRDSRGCIHQAGLLLYLPVRA